VSEPLIFYDESDYPDLQMLNSVNRDSDRVPEIFLSEQYGFILD